MGSSLGVVLFPELDACAVGRAQGVTCAGAKGPEEGQHDERTAVKYSKFCTSLRRGNDRRNAIVISLLFQCGAPLDVLTSEVLETTATVTSNYEGVTGTSLVGGAVEQSGSAHTTLSRETAAAAAIATSRGSFFPELPRARALDLYVCSLFALQPMGVFGPDQR